MAGALEGSCMEFCTDGAGWPLLCLEPLASIWRIRARLLLLAAAMFSEVEKSARPTAITGEVVVVLVIVTSEPGARARKPSFVTASISNKVVFSFFPSQLTLASP